MINLAQISDDVNKKTKIDKSLRLIFSYEGDNIKLLSSQKVNIIPPPSDDIQENREHSGFWYSLEDNNGRSLYHRVTRQRLHEEVEVFTNERENSIQRRKVENPKGTLILLVPDISEGHSVALFGSPTKAIQQSNITNNTSNLQPSTEIARFLIHANPDTDEVKE